jgi:hypothetical protein
VVFKPATLTPETGCAVVSIFERAGLPKGVLNMVLGSGATVGNALLDHEDVRAVSFTGSNDVGSQIYGRGARRMIRVQCEMGGKNPVIVLADADIDLAVEATAQGAFFSTGQRCTATSRVIVEAALPTPSWRSSWPARGSCAWAAAAAKASTWRSRRPGPARALTNYIEIGKAEARCAAGAGSRAGTSTTATTSSPPCSTT